MRGWRGCPAINNAARVMPMTTMKPAAKRARFPPISRTPAAESKNTIPICWPSKRTFCADAILLARSAGSAHLKVGAVTCIPNRSIPIMAKPSQTASQSSDSSEACLDTTCDSSLVLVAIGIESGGVKLDVCSHDSVFYRPILSAASRYRTDTQPVPYSRV
ncbi:MAG: hypothetical protein KatS3mg105_2442 [Gemmatales bacterium]|nr:MAG: hypothetical protein KatS3mg105_2442 [Gemmatales bacterium]